MISTFFPLHHICALFNKVINYHAHLHWPLELIAQRIKWIYGLILFHILTLEKNLNFLTLLFVSTSLSYFCCHWLTTLSSWSLYCCFTSAIPFLYFSWLDWMSDDRCETEARSCWSYIKKTFITIYITTYSVISWDNYLSTTANKFILWKKCFQYFWF